MRRVRPRVMGRTPAGAASRVPFLARLRVGPKLMLLVLLPVTGLLAFAAFGAVAQWREARTLLDFRTATRVSFSTTDVCDAVAGERIAAVLARLRPGADAVRKRSAAQRATDRALDGALNRAASWP